MRSNSLVLTLAVCLPVLIVGSLWLDPGPAANEDYSTGSPSCLTCHGDFRQSPYTSFVDGQSWADDLHDVHRRTMLNSDCNACHIGSSRVPTFIGSSAGGTGLAAISCAGCHGRSQDGSGTGSVGYGAGLRQRHWLANRTVAGFSTRTCVNCHSDANPASKVVVGENIKPPYYLNPGTNHPAMPTDPCNPSPFTENFKGTTIGLDNDGDGTFDMNDSNCQLVAAAPGEVSSSALNQLRVTAYNKLTGQLTIAYGPACSATTNNIEIGLLNTTAISSYAWSNRICSIGNSGSATFNPGGAAYFFVVVGNDGAREGSYGTRHDGTERPESTSAIGCANVPQDLANRCD